VIGLISWNEFSENSHIEPSENYGSRYLEVLADIRHAAIPILGDFDSSEPGSVMDNASVSRVIALGMLGALILFGLTTVARRSSRTAKG
jgi:hypothetical protein